MSYFRQKVHFFSYGTTAVHNPYSVSLSGTCWEMPTRSVFQRRIRDTRSRDVQLCILFHTVRQPYTIRTAYPLAGHVGRCRHAPFSNGGYATRESRVVQLWPTPAPGLYISHLDITLLHRRLGHSGQPGIQRLLSW